jgi:hypothetical protein
LTNFSNGKQTQESLESGFPESEFRETNMALASNASWKFHSSTDGLRDTDNHIGFVEGLKAYNICAGDNFILCFFF